MSTIPVSPDIQVPGSPAATSTTTSTAASPSITDFNSPPWVNVPGIVNFRDIGGYPISDGRRSVRRGLVYRSAEPSRVTADGRKKMQELGIKKMYDLRSEKELNRLGDLTKIVEIDGVERVFVPVIPDRDYSPEALARRYEMYMSGNLQDAYRSILSSDPTAYRTIFQHLLSPTPAPILIHCTAGKDRTGVICALILLIAGVEEELIAREYALTTTGLETMREVILQYLMKDKNSMRGSGRERAENMLSSNAETMLQFIKIVNEEYGGVKEYLSKVLGFTQEEIEEIRMHVVSEEEPLEGLLRKL